MELIDFFVAPIYFIIIYQIALKRGRKNYGYDITLFKYFKNTLLLKFTGAFFFSMVYQFYYKGGDTLCFFFWARAISQTLFNQPTDWFNYVFFNIYDSFIEIYSSSWAREASGELFNCFWIFKYGGSDPFFMKIASIITMLGFNLYLPTTFIFASISFFCNWKLYLVFHDLFPKNKKIFAQTILFVPSVFFWGSGILKDSITFSALSLLTYSVYFGFIKGNNLYKHLVISVFLSYSITLIKGYIILSFIPAGLYWVFSAYKDKIKNKTVRVIFTPIFLGIGILFSSLIVNNLSSSAGRFSIDKLEKTTKDYQSWHTVASEGGSGYSLGGVTEDFSVGNLLTKFPLAVNVTLFRPYLWEVNNIVMLFAAIESFLILYFTISTFLKVGIFNSINIIGSNSIIIFCLFFSIVFAFAVGFTSYNFGALVRYKIPCIPFYLAAIAMIRIKSGKFS
jgi:hypothetical protein